MSNLSTEEKPKRLGDGIYDEYRVGDKGMNF